MLLIEYTKPCKNYLSYILFYIQPNRILSGTDIDTQRGWVSTNITMLNTVKFYKCGSSIDAQATEAGVTEVSSDQYS